MKRETPKEKWERLTRLARQAPSVVPDLQQKSKLPLGLAERVAAQWAGGPSPRRTTLDLLERTGWFGAGLAILVCVLCLLLTRPADLSSEALALDALLFAPLPKASASDGLF